MILSNFYPRSPCGERPLLRGFFRVPAKNFYPRSPCGERHSLIIPSLDKRLISIHALLAESDHFDIAFNYTSNDFYPRSPCGERRRLRSFPSRSQNFYPRSPCGERPTGCTMKLPTMAFLSTLSLRRATYRPRRCAAQGGFLSTLSLRRATSCRGGWCPSTAYFYPRSPCGERHTRRRQGRPA